MKTQARQEEPEELIPDAFRGDPVLLNVRNMVLREEGEYFKIIKGTGQFLDKVRPVKRPRKEILQAIEKGISKIDITKVNKLIEDAWKEGKFDLDFHKYLNEEELVAFET